MKIPIPIRFWAKVRLAANGCWDWTACIDVHGYGQFNIGAGCRIGAHRWSYIDAYGRVPNGLELDHLCRNTKCVNPTHLEAVSHRVNMLRGVTFIAQRAVQTHCMRGHQFTPENTHRDRNNTRKCRTCVRERQRRQAALAKGKK